MAPEGPVPSAGVECPYNGAGRLVQWRWAVPVTLDLATKMGRFGVVAAREGSVDRVAWASEATPGPLYSAGLQLYWRIFSLVNAPTMSS